MAQTLPIFFMDATSPQGEGASDAGVTAETAIETGDGSGMFLASLNEAMATLPRDLVPSPSVEMPVLSIAVEPPVPEETETGEEPFSGEIPDSPALTWENGCQVGLAMGQERQPAGYTFVEDEFASESPPPRPIVIPHPVETASVPVVGSPVSTPVRTVSIADPVDPLPVLKRESEPVGNPIQPEMPPKSGLPVSEASVTPIRVEIARPAPRETIPVVAPPLPVEVKAVISIRPVMIPAEGGNPEKTMVRDEPASEEIPKPVSIQKGGERFSDFSGGGSHGGRRENPRPDSESLPDWEISLRADADRSEPMAGRHPVSESPKAPEPGLPTVFRAPLPQLPVLLFQRLVETTGEMSRAESRRQEFVVQIEPEHLGRVQVAVEIHQGRIAARIAVDSDAVRQAMDAQLPALKQALEQQGLRLESIEVSVQDRHASLLNPEGRDSESFFHQRRSHGKGGEGNAEADPEADPALGETGRRFGLNTVEYFA